MRNMLGLLLYFFFLAMAIVLIFALGAGLVYLIVIGEEAFSWDLVSGSLFFIILAVIFWICGQAARHFLTDGAAGKTSPPDRNASP